MDYDHLVDELPSTIKEEILFHQYGQLISRFDFFQTLQNNDFVWGILRNLSKTTYDKFDIIYKDNQIANAMYFIHKGYVKLYAENDYAFAVFRQRTCFGEYEIMLNQRRNGTAKAMDYCQIYHIKKEKLDDLLIDYPSTRKDLIGFAIQKSKTLMEHR